MSLITFISTLTYAGDHQVHTQTLSVTDGADFCEKARDFLSNLNSATGFKVTLLQCDTQENGWFHDTVETSLLYRHKNCLVNEIYFRPIQFLYEGVEYIDAIKQIVEDVGLKFISQTSDDSTLEKANNGSFQITLGIPRCMEQK